MDEKYEPDIIQPTLEELSKEIHSTERKLKELRDQYLSRTGVLPPRTMQDKDWRWTIYMTLGIAYITFITYFLGIKQSGRGEGFWIPDFLYNAEVQFYGVLSFFIIFALHGGYSARISSYAASSHNQCTSGTSPNTEQLTHPLATSIVFTSHFFLFPWS